MESSLGDRPLKPLAAREADGRIAVYIGSGFALMPEVAARSLRDQLTRALEEIGPQKEPS